MDLLARNLWRLSEGCFARGRGCGEEGGVLVVVVGLVRRGLVRWVGGYGDGCRLGLCLFLFLFVFVRLWGPGKGFYELEGAEVD